MGQAYLFKEINSHSDANIGKYYLPIELKEIQTKQNSITFFYFNIPSLLHHFWELHTLLASSQITFDVIGITESRLKGSKNYLTNVTIQKYTTTEYCLTDCI